MKSNIKFLNYQTLSSFIKLSYRLQDVAPNFISFANNYLQFLDQLTKVSRRLLED